MARGKRKRDKIWIWVAKPGDRIFVSRTAVIPSKQISRREFRALEEILNIYSRMLGMYYPTHPGILSRAIIGLIMRSTES
jgi:hypothetical protein